MSSIHLDLLDKQRREVFEKLEAFSKSAVLGGETALMLQIAHRLSFDFDLFVGRPLEKEDLSKARRTFKIAQILVNTKEQLTVITDRGIDITWLYYPYRPIASKVKTSSLSLCAVEDIAADKAYTIGRRATWRDYVDLYFIFRQDLVNIFDLVKLSERKFGVEFNPKLFLEQLVYFEDIEISKMSFVQEKPTVLGIQDFLKKQVKEFREKELSV